MRGERLFDDLEASGEAEDRAEFEADRERIFERFYTCSQSRNKLHSGTGLGLSIVKHIANLYDGVVRVETNREGGNRFIVILCEKGATQRETAKLALS